MISGSLDTVRERPTDKEVVVSINRHLVLELAEMWERVVGSRVLIEGGRHKFSRETERGDFLRQG